MPGRTSVILSGRWSIQALPVKGLSGRAGTSVKEATVKTMTILTHEVSAKAFPCQHPRSTIGCRSLGCGTLTAPTYAHVIYAGILRRCRVAESHRPARASRVLGCSSLDPSRDRSPLTESKVDYRNRLDFSADENNQDVKDNDRVGRRDKPESFGM